MKFHLEVTARHPRIILKEETVTLIPITKRPQTYSSYEA